MDSLKKFKDRELIQELRKRNYAFIIWGIEDIFEVAKDLELECNTKQAIDIIHNIDRKADCEIGITWDTLIFWVQEICASNKIN